MLAPRIVISAVVSVLLVAPGSAAQSGEAPRLARVTLPSGETVVGAVERIDAAGLAIRPSGAEPQEIPWASMVGVVVTPRRTPPDAAGGPILTLASGERLPGCPEANASGIRWLHPLLGPIDASSDRIRWMTFDEGPPPLGDAKGDMILLRNGDRRQGFVSGLSDPLLLESASGDRSASSIPLPSVRAIAFVTSEPSTVAPGRRVWLADGTVLEVDQVRWSGGDDAELQGIRAASGRTVRMPLDLVAAISGAAPARPLAALARRIESTPQAETIRYALTPATLLAWPGRRPTDEATRAGAEADAGAWPLGAPSLAFDGPAKLVLELDRPGRIVANIVLPTDRRPWGRFELVIRRSGVEGGASPTVLGRHAFSAEQPVFELAIDAVPPGIELEIVDTGDGPVQDGVVIERGLVLPPPAGPASPAG